MIEKGHQQIDIINERAGCERFEEPLDLVGQASLAVKNLCVKTRSQQ
jgi:hypothetical protein